VLSSDYKLEILRKAKEEGYFIKCVFVLTVDPIINVARVEARVAQGGHNVARDKIISRYEKSLANIKELLEICDILHVYDNTIEPKRIIRKHKEDISVFANDLWNEEQILSLMNP
jgi:predicted ABC-type ATPase